MAHYGLGEGGLYNIGQLWREWSLSEVSLYINVFIGKKKKKMKRNISISFVERVHYIVFPFRIFIVAKL